MRVLAACSLGGAGHLNPLVPFLDAARRRGDEVLVVGPPALQDMVERTGHAFRPGGEPPEDLIAPIRERLPVAPPLEASVLGNRELFGRLATAAMLPLMRQVCAAWSPDLVLRDPCEYSSAVVSHELGIPTAQVAISLASAETGSIAAAAPALEEHRAGLVRELRASPYLTRFPASLDPSDFATTVRYADPGHTVPAQDRVASAVEPDLVGVDDWWRDADAPRLYLTLGTVLGYMSIAADVYRVALEAVADLDVRVLLTVGRRFDARSLTPVPANVRVEAWIDQAVVLRDADLVVCHGGSGTVLGALAAGVPIVVVPVFADQFENARRVAGCGAGLVVVAEGEAAGGGRPRVRPEDAPRITQAIRAVLASDSYRDRARTVAAEMAATPSAGDVLDALFTP